MELTLKPSQQNSYALGGILIRGASVKSWLLSLQAMKLSLRETSVYPVPGQVANTIWGCLVVFRQKPDASTLGKNEWVQQVSPSFYIATHSGLFPAMTSVEIDQLFGTNVWVMHPEFGLVELTETIDFSSLISLPAENNARITTPAKSVVGPESIRSFQIAPVTAEDALQKLEEEAFPKRKKLENKPLNLVEKLKRSFYRGLFQKTAGKGSRPGPEGSGGGSFGIDISKPSALGTLFSAFLKPFMRKGKSFTDQVQPDLEELERRNQQQIDRLLDMLKKNPDEALKYAIPLDEGGSSRGPTGGSLDLSMRWSILSILANRQTNSGGGGTVDIGNRFHDLQRQYEAMAEQLIKDGDYTKAAFVYMKLLKNHRRAAETLEKGHQYREAASIYLKHLNDKNQAAVCYEKGNLIANAIELYKEMGNHEKTGDLYLQLNQKKEAFTYFEMVVEADQKNRQFRKASDLLRNKMENPERAQESLLEGWRTGSDGVNCLKNYFEHIPDPKTLKKELRRTYETEVDATTQESFLQVLKHHTFQKEELKESVEEMAYEIVALSAQHHPAIVKELKHFNPDNKRLIKDTIRFSINRSKRKKS